MRNLFLIFLSTLTLSAGIGKVSAMRGDVKIERGGKTIPVTKGFQIEEKDTILTTKRSKAQLRFKDNTVIRVGRNAVFKIEEYLYDKSNKSKAKFKAKNGFFSAVTGGIGKVAKDRFKLKTKTSTIGIRGTHFQGTVDDSTGEEEIACLRGAITVEIAGQLLDVEAGEIMSVKDGASSPVRKIQSKDIKSMDSKEISALVTNLNGQVNALASVKDSDAKYQEYQKLTSQINEAYHTEVEKFYTKDVVLAKNSDGSVQMELYTKETVELPENPIISENLETIQAGTPYNVSITRDEIANPSEEAISNYIPSFKSWDGQNENGKIAKYSGNMVFAGEVDYNPDVTLEVESDLDRETITDNQVLLENGVEKEINFEADYLNSFVGGSFQYGNDEIQFSNSGTGALGSETFLFYGNNILSNNVETTGAGAVDIYFGLNQGELSNEELNTILATDGVVVIPEDQTAGLLGVEGYILLTVPKNSEKSSEYYTTLFQENGVASQYYQSEDIMIGVQNSGYSGDFDTLSAEVGISWTSSYLTNMTLRGGFIAEKVSETEIYKKDIDSDEIFSWGYWAYQFEGEDEKIRGGWITTDLERTARENIPQIATASYSGDIYGTVENALEGKSASEIENGTFGFDFDFTNKKMDGDIQFSADETDYSMQFEATNQLVYEDGADHDFEFKKSLSTSVTNIGVEDAPQFVLESGDNPEYMQGQGNFYGENGENIAGGFTAGFENGDTAIATFKGSKE